MRRRDRLGERPVAAHRARGPHALTRRRCALRNPRRGRLVTSKQGGERPDQHAHERRLSEIGVPPADRGDQELRERCRHGAREAVGRLHDRDRHAPVAHEAAREDGHEHHEPEAVGSEGHEDAVEHDDLPERADVGAAQEPEREDAPAQQHEAARAEAVHQHADEGRAHAAHERGHRERQRRLGAAPPELLEERDEEHRIGVHQRRADGEGHERAAQQETAPRGHALSLYNGAREP